MFYYNMVITPMDIDELFKTLMYLFGDSKYISRNIYTTSRCNHFKDGDNEEKMKVKTPIMDSEDTKDQIILYLEVPGANKDDIDLQTEGRKLFLEAKAYKDLTYKKELRIPDQYNIESAKVSLLNGILTIKLDKIKEKKNQLTIE